MTCLVHLPYLTFRSRRNIKTSHASLNHSFPPVRPGYSGALIGIASAVLYTFRLFLFFQTWAPHKSSEHSATQVMAFARDTRPLRKARACVSAHSHFAGTLRFTPFITWLRFVLSFHAHEVHAVRHKAAVAATRSDQRPCLAQKPAAICKKSRHS